MPADTSSLVPSGDSVSAPVTDGGKRPVAASFTVANRGVKDSGAGRIPLPRGAVVARDGLLIVDKPAGRTSHDIVAAVRRLAATKKVGHAGTLDPMATGVLVLGIGRATKLLTYVVGARKTYSATIRLGASTITDDAEGDIVTAAGCNRLTVAELNEWIEPLRGDIQQVPSSVSAIKIDGKRSYARVRAGEEVKLQPRPVTIYRFDVCAEPCVLEVDGVQMVDVDVEVECSSGTYIRALARDLGQALGCGGYLTSLCRSSVGPFTRAEASGLSELAAQVEADAAGANPRGLVTVSIDTACSRYFPVRDVGADAEQLRYGRPIAPSGCDGVVAACDDAGHAVALIQDRGAHARPVFVIDPA